MMGYTPTKSNDRQKLTTRGDCNILPSPLGNSQVESVMFYFRDFSDVSGTSRRPPDLVIVRICPDVKAPIKYHSHLDHCRNV